ncbi:MAG: hypothetical protein ACRD06_00400 [Terriglobia bacterium]
MHVGIDQPGKRHEIGGIEDLRGLSRQIGADLDDPAGSNRDVAPFQVYAMRPRDLGISDDQIEPLSWMHFMRSLSIFHCVSI